jgi:hypothetical protein
VVEAPDRPAGCGIPDDRLIVFIVDARPVNLCAGAGL